jgi:TATA-box binding protein (TBP) (component of TFIID and TFIIIB)
MISTGAKSIDRSIKQLHRAMDLLVKSKFVKRVKLVPRVQNIVATVILEQRIDLITLTTHVTPITYEADQFPGGYSENLRRTSLLDFFIR